MILSDAQWWGLTSHFQGRMLQAQAIRVSPIPFAIIEDLIVDQARRSTGIGTAVMDWIAAEARARNIRRLFLESGVRNSGAHDFFERNGFRVCSVVMTRSLD